MKNLLAFFLIALMAFNFVACSDDDDGGTGTDPQTETEAIVGTWVSEGDNVAPLLVNVFKIVKITATFNDNGTYEVIQVDSAGTSLTLAGTYEVEKSEVGNIYTIKANQQTPAALVSEGIYEIDESANPWTMQYEVVQTSPDIGATPPTPSAGFGSTSGGALGTSNIQKYVKQ